MDMVRMSCQSAAYRYAILETFIRTPLCKLDVSAQQGWTSFRRKRYPFQCGFCHRQERCWNGLKDWTLIASEK